MGWSIAEDDNQPDENALKNVTSDRVVYACWEKKHVNSETGEILDSWAEINEAMGNGTYSEIYSVGNWKNVNYGSTYGEAVPMEIVAFDTDNMTSGGKAPITWIAKGCLLGTYKWNSASDNTGGYYSSLARQTLENNIFPSMESGPKPYIVEVSKTERQGSGTSGATVINNYSIWLPSAYEIYGTTLSASNFQESSGNYYSEAFGSNAQRIKYTTGTSTAVNWWLRTALYSNTDFAVRVTTGGNISNYACANSIAFAPGFCTSYNPNA